MTAAPRCLIVHPGALGDVLLALPALAHLAELLPGARRVVAVAPRIGALLSGSTHAERALDFEDLRLHRVFVPDADPAVLQALGEYAAIVSWFGASDATYRRHLAGLPGRVVVARPTPAGRTHASRHLLDTLAILGPAPDAIRAIPLAVPAAAREWAEAWLAERGLRAGEAVVVHPGAGSPRKVWPGFAALARRLRAAGVPAVAVLGPADAGAERWLGDEGGLSERMMARDTSLPAMAALLAAARAFVGNDSGPTHLAAAVGCPTLALFGPSDPAVWAPVGRTVSVLASRDSGGLDPWRTLSVDRVVDALAGLGDAVCARLALVARTP